MAPHQLTEDMPTKQAEKSVDELIRRYVEAERYWAYATSPKRSLKEVLQDGRLVAATRTDAERDLVKLYRQEHPTERDEAARLLELGKARIWDLREELRRKD